MEIKPMTYVKVGVGVTVLVVGGVVFVKFVLPVLNALGAAGKIFGQAAGAVQSVRPKIIFKGVEPEDDLTLLEGLIQ